MEKKFEFEKEKTTTTAAYPTEYIHRPSAFRNMNAIPQQMELIERFFPEFFPQARLNREILEKFERKEIHYPRVAERAIILPHWQGSSGSYVEAVKKVLRLLEKRYKGNFVNQIPTVMTPQKLKEISKKKLTLLRNREEQDSDLMLFGAQFGECYAGMSPRHASEHFSMREIPLGIFEVAVMLLLYPERLQLNSHLGCICLGDTIAMSGTTENFSARPYFAVKNGKLELNEMWFGHMDSNLGSVTGFTLIGRYSFEYFLVVVQIKKRFRALFSFLFLFYYYNRNIFREKLFMYSNRFLSRCIAFFLCLSLVGFSNVQAFTKVNFKQSITQQTYTQEISRFQKLYKEVQSELSSGKFSTAQLKKIKLLEQNITRNLKAIDISKTSEGTRSAKRSYDSSVLALEKYVKSLTKKVVRTPNVRNPSPVSETQSESLVTPSKQATPDSWTPDASAKIVYYSDAFEGGNTSSGDEFSQNRYSAANCSASLNQLIQVRSGEDAVIVKVNDRPNCAKYSDIVDLSKIAFSELGRLESGTLQGSFKKLDSLPGEYTKEYLDINSFSTLGIEFDKGIPNMYLLNDTLSLSGKILNGGTESLIYAISPSGKIISYGKDSETAGRFEYKVPLLEVGKYDLVVASGRSFRSVSPKSFYVIDPAILQGKALFSESGENTAITKISTERSEAADLSPTHLVHFNTSSSSLLSEFSLFANGKKWTRSGFGTVAFDPLEFKGVSSGTSGDVLVTTSRSSTPFSMDTVTPKKTEIERKYKLVPNYGTTKEVDYTSALSGQKYRLELKGESNLPIHSTVYIMTPTGTVDTVNFSQEFVSGNTLSKTNGASFEYTMKDEGVYLVEVNYNNGFAAVIEPVVVGGALAILPNEYDLQDKTIETNMAFARNQILKDINAIRARAGLGPVSFDASMQQIADTKADDMASNNYVGHRDSNGDYALGLAKRLGINIQGSIGENVAGGTVGAQYLQAGLSLSPGHRLNMLGERWNKVGVSIMVRNERVYVVEIFSE